MWGKERFLPFLIPTYLKRRSKRDRWLKARSVNDATLEGANESYQAGHDGRPMLVYEPP